jgi:hypothetical protein
MGGMGKGMGGSVKRYGAVGFCGIFCVWGGVFLL